MSQGLLARSRGFRLFWGGRTISLAGTQIARVALTVLVYRLGGGAAGISILLLAFTLPRLLGPLAGAIADRSDNKRLMVSCDLAQALLFAALAWVRWWPAVVVLVLIATLFATAYLPAGRGNIPLIVGRENLARANALLVRGTLDIRRRFLGRRGWASETCGRTRWPAPSRSCYCLEWASPRWITRRSSSWCARGFTPARVLTRGW